jgi:ABC-type multidrug transport system fused ATPase/permease subunit
MKKYFSTIRRLWLILKDFRKHFYIQLLLTIVDQAIAIAVTLLLAKTLDALISKNVDFLWYVLILYPLVSIIKNRISLFKNLHELKYLGNSIQQFLEEYSFKNIFSLTVSQYSEDHSSIKLQTINRGENAVQNIIETIVLTLIPVATQVLFSLIAISFYSVSTAVWCALTLVIIILWANKFSEYHRPFIKNNINNWDVQRKVRTEAFQHLSLIKLFASEESYLSKYLSNRHSVIEYSIFTFRKGMINGHWRGLFMIFSRTFSYVLIVRSFLFNFITTGSVFAIWTWINDIYSNIFSVIRAISQMPIRFVELEKYLDIIDKKPTFVEGGATVFRAGDIIFNKVGLTYSGAESFSLNHLNLHIKSGQKVALVGVSGGGKSSLVKLLMRAYDYTTGSIKIGETELRDFDYKSLRSHIEYVDQHVDLFDTSIKDNILLGVTRIVTDDELKDLAQKARITQFYDRLGDKGLDTEIGERGIKLSGGERQRVGIARALIRNPEILIFDEATSALDTENESYIKEAIDEASKGRTTIIIAHRLSTVRDADKIIVMDKGTVVAEGTHEKLLEKSSHYRTLVAHQLSE